MEEDAEAVHLDQAEKCGAAGVAGENRRGGAKAGAQDSEEGEHLAAAGKRLQEHQEHAEGAPDSFGQDAEKILRLGNHGRGAAFAAELMGRSCCAVGSGKSRSRGRPLGMTVLVDGTGLINGKAMPSAAKAGRSPFLMARLKSCPDVASWGKFRCIWSSTFWDGAAKRRVK